MKRRRKSWSTSYCKDKIVYNVKLARKLHKIAQHVMRIAKGYGLSYVALVAIGAYASVRAQEEDGTTATTVVDDYIFTAQED